MKYKILHLDDDPLELRSFKRLFKDNTQFDLYSVINIHEFNEYLYNIKNIDFIILDIHLASENMSGLSLIANVKAVQPNSIILMSSNYDDPLSILESLNLGADEFLSKKIRSNDIAHRLISLQKKAFIKKGCLVPQGEVSFARGAMMKKIEQRIPNIIHSAIKFVYVEGASGTGKEVVADLFSKYLKNKPFIKLNCAAIPKDLIESELFGHKKGSFTGAQFDKKGVIESAHGGWLFLDEVASLTPSAQSILLRTLENQEVTPIGETSPRKINVRFISASNVSLANMVSRGAFRNDLWQRLRETEIFLLQLHERKEEIPELINYFCQHMDGGPYQIEETALNVLSKFSWQEGNVRELRNCLRAMTENHNEKILSPMGIPTRILQTYYTKKEISIHQNSEQFKNNDQNIVQVPLQNKDGVAFNFEEITFELLKNIIFRTKQVEGKINITKLSKDLNLARSTLQAKIKMINNYDVSNSIDCSFSKPSSQSQL